MTANDVRREQAFVRNRKIIEAVEAGMTYAKVARKFRRSRGAVAGIMNRARKNGLAAKSQAVSSYIKL